MLRRKRRTSSIRLIRILIWCILIFLLCYVFIFSKSGYLARAKLEHRILRLEEEIANLKKCNEKLREEIEILNSPLYLEKLARKLGIAKPGEEIVEFIKEEERK